MSEELRGDFRRFMDKNFLGAWDLPDKDDLILTIDYVSRDEVQNDRGREKKLALHFKEREYKPMICNTTNAKAISKAHNSTKVEDWKNKQIALYKATISAFGQTQECIRVRDYPPRSNTLICADCGEEIKPHDKYTARVIAERAKSKYGAFLCWDCAQIRKESDND